MAFNKTVFLLVLLLLLVVVEQADSASSSHHVDIIQISRKILMGSSAVLVHGIGSSRSSVNIGEQQQQLRTVPSGPDPLHHNGANPKKPTTP